MNGDEQDGQYENTLQEAMRICSGDRNASYGEPIDNHGLTAAMYAVYLNGRMRAGKVLIDAKGVCALNILQKLSRTVYGDWDRNTVVDIEGYAFNVEKIMLVEEAHYQRAVETMNREAAAEELIHGRSPVADLPDVNKRKALPRRRGPDKKPRRVAPKRGPSARVRK